VEFTIGKTKVDPTRERVEEVLEKLDPEPLKGEGGVLRGVQGEEVSHKAGSISRHRPPQGLVHDYRTYEVLRELGFKVKELKGG